MNLTFDFDTFANAALISSIVALIFSLLVTRKEKPSDDKNVRHVTK